jgi:hypothetical protein
MNNDFLFIINYIISLMRKSTSFASIVSVKRKTSASHFPTSIINSRYNCYHIDSLSVTVPLKMDCALQKDFHSEVPRGIILCQLTWFRLPPSTTSKESWRSIWRRRRVHRCHLGDKTQSKRPTFRMCIQMLMYKLSDSARTSSLSNLIIL